MLNRSIIRKAIALLCILFLTACSSNPALNPEYFEINKFLPRTLKIAYPAGWGRIPSIAYGLNTASSREALYKKSTDSFAYQDVLISYSWGPISLDPSLDPNKGPFEWLSAKTQIEPRLHLGKINLGMAYVFGDGARADSVGTSNFDASFVIKNLGEGYYATVLIVTAKGGMSNWEAWLADPDSIRFLP